MWYIRFHNPNDYYNIIYLGTHITVVKLGVIVMEFVKFKCYYCSQVFSLQRKQVIEAEKIAVIKCPECGGTEDISEEDIQTK